MLGHELRNPLGTIGTAMAVLERGPRKEHDGRVIAIVSRQTRHLARLVDDLLDISRLTSGNIRLRREPVDLHALAARTIDAYREGGRAAAHEIVLAGQPVYADGDVARLEQIVSNLLDNALKYTPAGGRITVATARSGAHAELTVRDTGAGISAELLPRVFDLFVQAPQPLDRGAGGLGLGLAIVKALVTLHGGTVSAASDGAERGSAFTIRLEAVDAPPTAETAPPSRAAAGRTRRVLVVEDNADAAEMLRMLLETHGHTVAVAPDGPRGVEMLGTFAPDIALVDIGLPGFDGYEVARRARAGTNTRGIPLVAITGYGQPTDRARALAAGFDRHMTKPVDPAALEALVSGRARL
jgi:CheY-like chemotaxis protein/two-component sensor histidine kinase